jgi:poly(A) polymerase
VSPGDAKALAYRIGAEEAVDRLLLGDAPAELVAADVQSLADWEIPRLPLSGGDLISMGLRPGPLVARTLQAIEREWIGASFPADRETVSSLARACVDQALRENQ